MICGARAESAGCKREPGRVDRGHDAPYLRLALRRHPQLLHPPRAENIPRRRPTNMRCSRVCVFPRRIPFGPKIESSGRGIKGNSHLGQFGGSRCPILELSDVRDRLQQRSRKSIQACPLQCQIDGLNPNCCLAKILSWPQKQKHKRPQLTSVVNFGRS